MSGEGTELGSLQSVFVSFMSQGDFPFTKTEKESVKYRLTL